MGLHRLRLDMRLDNYPKAKRPLSDGDSEGGG